MSIYIAYCLNNYQINNLIKMHGANNNVKFTVMNIRVPYTAESLFKSQPNDGLRYKAFVC